MSRKDRSTMIAVGMSWAVRDMPTRLRCSLREERPDAGEFRGLGSRFERHERRRKAADRMTRSHA